MHRLARTWWRERDSHSLYAVAATALCVVALLTGAGGLSAQAQLPDLRQMSGQPLPSAELPNGTIVVRVVRQAVTNNIPSQAVQLREGTRVRMGQTDASGRATFADLAPGSTWTAVTIVDGEELSSQPITVPQSGGIRVLLAAGLGAGTAAPGGPSAPSAPAVAPVPGDVALGGQTRFVIELGDQAIEVYGLLELTNGQSTPVMPAKPVILDPPPTAEAISVLDGSSPQAKVQGKQIVINGPFAPGVTSVQTAYRLPYSGSTLHFQQVLPLALAQSTVIVRKLDGLGLSLPNQTGQRDVPLEQRLYLVTNAGGVAAGSPLDVTLTGLPHRPVWPRYTALSLAALMILIAAWVSVRGPGRALDEEEAQQWRARRKTLFDQLVALEKRRPADVDADPAWIARRRQLLGEIEELDEALADHALVHALTPSAAASAGVERAAAQSLAQR